MSAPARGLSAARTAVVWEALQQLLRDRAADAGSTPGDAPADTAGSGAGLRVLDIGGGTGGFAVRVAELGHHVTVVDPSPDALAILDRRSEETGVADRVTGMQGDIATVPGLVGAGTVDVVLCHGVLEVVDDPAAALAAVTEVLRPEGSLSLLVAQRHASVVARAMAGHLEQARELLEGRHDGRTPRRFTAEETTTLLADAGFTGITLHAVRVFGDLVPSSLVDGEPRTSAALAELERAVADRPEYLTLATQVHALATRRR